MNSSIEIVMRKIGELKPYENNPRHNDMAVDAVAASIQQFGFKNPVIIDKDGVIVAGHTRYKAAKKLGIFLVIHMDPVETGNHRHTMYQCR